MADADYLDVGPALLGGWRVCRVTRPGRITAAVLFETAADVAAAAALVGLAVLTDDTEIAEACAAQRVPTLPAPLARQEYMPL